MPILKLRIPFEEGNVYIWRFRPTEIIDLRIIQDARSLIIMADRTDLIPIQGPCLDAILFTSLTNLEFQDLDITNIGKIPRTVETLRFNNTTLTNIHCINADWSKINYLYLSNNRQLNRTSITIPEGIIQLKINLQILKIIRLPSTIQDVQIELSIVDQLTGQMPRRSLSYPDTRFSYSDGLRTLAKECHCEQILSWPVVHMDIAFKWHLKKLEYINQENHEMNYRIYQEFGEIPKRIHISKYNIANPIVVALNLCSNYPRRMAEFMTENTYL